MTPVLEVRGLCKAYGPIQAVDHLSFTAFPGQVFGLLGPNGAGKTTTIKCLCTLERPDAGEVIVAGQSAIQHPRAVRRLLGYVAQEVALDQVLTGWELLSLQADLYHLRRDVARARIAQMLHLVDLADRADHRIATYSGGMKKRLDLAAGLLHQPPVLVLDEPTVGLDIQTRVRLWDFIRHLKAQGTTVILTSHYLEEVDALADRIAILDHGRLIAQGSSAELKNSLGGDVVTLKVQEYASPEVAQQAATALRPLPFVRDIVVNAAQGNALSIVITPDERAVPEMTRRLRQVELEVFAVSISKPSLDDIFLKATGTTLHAAQLQATEARQERQGRGT